MATRKVPHSADPANVRLREDLVTFRLWVVPEFPLGVMGGKLDKDPEQVPWIMGLLEDIRKEGGFRNPVVVWNHHPHRLTGKQPKWLLRAGSNRVWCAEQLGWETVPAVVSTVPGEEPPAPAVETHASSLDLLFRDGGVCWANEHGFGLLGAKRPEITYDGYEGPLLPATTHYRRGRLINPMKDPK